MICYSGEKMVKKIMIVDDETDVTESLKLVLERTGPHYKVTCVNSGEECLEMLENNKIPDLILLDIMMPTMSGWDVFHKLRENTSWKEIPIILLTALPDRGAKDVEGAGIKDYITKPIEVSNLMERIDVVLKKVELERKKKKDMGKS